MMCTIALCSSSFLFFDLKFWWREVLVAGVLKGLLALSTLKTSFLTTYSS